MKTVRERFWEKVEIGSAEACWNWTAATDRFGRGRFKWNGTTGYAPRFAFEQHFHEIPEGLFVLHTCDNPGCCNPAHLFLGTLEDNNRDREAKGRGADVRGSKNPAAKITEAVAQQIVNLLNHGYSLKHIKQLGYSWNCAQNIKYMKAWTHLPGAGGWKGGIAHDRTN